MKPLNYTELMLCRDQARIFEMSVKKTSYSSLIFIRRFMHSSIAESMDKGQYLYQFNSIMDSFDIIDEEFGKSNYGKIKYNEDQMYWIGYIYRCISIKYDLSSKAVYKLFNADEIIKYYNICHTFDVVDAAERLMESIDYDTTSIEEKAIKAMRRLHYTDRLTSLLGSEVKVHIDKPIGTNSDGILYTQNYGYVKDLKTLDNKYQGVYVLGVDKPISTFNGKIIGIINRTDDLEDKLLVSKDINFTKEEIKKMVDFQEKLFKSKIILFNTI